MNYYIEQNNKIVLCDTDVNILKNTILFTPQYSDLEIKETEREIINLNDELVFKDEHEEEIRRKEEERVAKLTMTALDFITFLQLAGLTLEQINAYLEANLPVKMQLTYCQNVYCGVACALMPITVGDVTITKEMVILAFKKKNGELE